MKKQPLKRGAKPKDYGKKKHPITVYATGEQIEAKGGIEKCREIALKSITG